MSLLDTLSTALAWVSRACGFETVDSFPSGHPYARTRWNGVYFDIASDLKPDAIERAICEKIAATPSIFAYIEHPTPRMQRELLAVIETRMRRSCGQPADVGTSLAALLVEAYRSPHTIEAVPGLRRVIQDSGGDPRAVLAYLGAMAAESVVIDA
jgi:uncharacterized membrane protein